MTALYTGSPTGMNGNNMPQTLTFVFETADLAAIREWVEAGTPDD